MLFGRIYSVMPIKPIELKLKIKKKKQVGEFCHLLIYEIYIYIKCLHMGCVCVRMRVCVYVLFRG